MNSVFLAQLVKDKFFLFYACISALLIGVVGIIVFILTTGSTAAPQQTATISPTPTIKLLTVSVEKIIPGESSQLTSGLPHTFYIYFSGPITLDQVYFTMTYTYFYEDKTTPIPVKTEAKLLGKNVIELKTITPIEQGAEYVLDVKGVQDKATLSSITYTSLDIPQTPVPANNQALIPHLPYTTNNYNLEYIKAQKLYVFHFIYNPDSPQTLDEQYDAAKAEAIRFIESKGVRLDSIVIEWRYS